MKRTVKVNRAITCVAASAVCAISGVALFPGVASARSDLDPSNTPASDGYCSTANQMFNSSRQAWCANAVEQYFGESDLANSRLQTPSQPGDTQTPDSLPSPEDR